MWAACSVPRRVLQLNAIPVSGRTTSRLFSHPRRGGWSFPLLTVTQSGGRGVATSPGPLGVFLALPAGRAHSQAWCPGFRSRGASFLSPRKSRTGHSGFRAASTKRKLTFSKS